MIRKVEVAFALCALVGLWVNASPVRVAQVDADVVRVQEKERVFSNRSFAFSSEAARALKGLNFIRFANQDAIDLKVESAGELVVMTPVPESEGMSKADALEAYGFVRDTSIAPFQPFGSNRLDRAAIWRKAVNAGERYSFTKCWCVVCGVDAANQRVNSDMLVNKPDYVVFVPRMPDRFQNKKLTHTPEELRMRGDSYNDHFQVLSDEKRKMLFAFWTQASYEGASDQHIAFSKSADDGKTWTYPIVLAGSECRAYAKLRASWQQPMLAKGGRLYCLWNQQTTSRAPHFGQMFGSYSDDCGETWSEPMQVPFEQRMDQDDPDPTVPPCWCNWQRPLRLGAGGRYFVGCSRHGKAPYDKKSCCKIEFWQFENIDENPLVEKIRLSYFATNRNMLDISKITPIPGVQYFVPTKHPHGGEEDPAVEEASIMKLPDGRLFAVMRSSVGSPVWSQSRDGGRTWSGVKALLNKDGGTPYKHPRSPCPFYDWKGPEAGSGLYFGLIHGTFDMTQKTAYQARGPLYLIAGRFNPKAEQPVEFAEPKLFAPRKWGNSFYASYTVLNGKGVLWFNDKKYYLLGRTIGPEWFGGVPAPKPLQVYDETPAHMCTNAFGRTLHDFGKDGFGWLEINATATGTCFVVYGERVKGDNTIDRFVPFKVRVASARWEIDKLGWQRVPFAPDVQNSLVAAEGAPIDIVPQFGIVAPFRAVETVVAPFPLTRDSYRRMRVAYPLDLTESSFTCDDAALVKVWDFCKYTVWSTSFTGYMVDGDRERIPYEADAYITQLAAYGISSDYAYARRSIEYLYEHPTWPTEFKQCSIMSAWTDWMYTGDLSSAAKYYEVFKTKKLLSEAARASDGLLVTGGERFAGSQTNALGYADIVDWPRPERDGFVFRPVNAVVNAFHYRNLKEMADLATALGKTEDAAQFRAMAARVRKAFAATFVDAQTGLCVDGEGTTHTSLHANAAALVCGVLPEASRARVAKWLAERGMACSVYFANYLLEALFENGYERAAFKRMTAKDNRSWLGMLAQGATMTTESWNVGVKPNEDWNHAWAAAPAGLVARYVCGVKPLEAGFAKIALAPHFGDLQRLDAKIPTARGIVQMKLAGDTLTVNVPAPTVFTYGSQRLEWSPGEHVFRRTSN